MQTVLHIKTLLRKALIIVIDITLNMEHYHQLWITYHFIPVDLFENTDIKST